MNWLNKIFNLPLLFATLSVSLFFVSCVADGILQPDHDNSFTAGKSDYYYSAIKLRVNGNVSTRASQADNIFWDKGYEGEEALYLNYDPESETPHFILFLDETETNVIDIFPLIFEEGTTADESEDEYTAYIKTYLDDETLIKYKDIAATRVLAILNDNGGIYKEIKSKLSKTTPETVDVASLICNDAKDNFFIEKEDEDKTLVRYFTMSSSMKYDPVDKSKVIPVVVDKDGMFGFHLTEEDAKDDPFTIYLERLQAKYTLLIRKDGKLYYLTDENLDDYSGDDSAEIIPTNSLFLSPKPYEDEDGELKDNKLKYVRSYTRSPSIDQRREINPQEGVWKINILGWGLNGLEANEYYIKQLDNTSGIIWADEYSYRYLWAKDPHYLKGEGDYPDQYRTVLNYSIEKDNNGHYTVKSAKNDNIKDYQGNTRSDFALSYLPFSSFTDKKPIKYIAENTFHRNLFDDQSSFVTDINPFVTRLYIRTGSHLILSCQLLIDGIDNSSLLTNERVNPSTGMAEYSLFTAENKYLMNDIFWSEDAYKAYVVEYLGYFMLTPQNKALFGNNDGYIYKNKEGVRVDGENFEVANAPIIGGDGKVYVQPKADRTLYRYDPDLETEHEEDKYFEIPHDQLIFLAIQHDELMAQGFREGRMYYCEATQHNPNADGNLNTGDYGTVRNNWYSFEVAYIQGVGNPVSDTSEPIVPNHEDSGNAIGLGMKLLDWHYEYGEVDVNNQPRPGQNAGGSGNGEDSEEDQD